jgi:hypothetical protein
MNKSKQVFNASSPGFLYTIIVAVLTIFAVSGVHFPSGPEALSGDIVTTLSNSGIYAIIGIIISSVIFPIYNAIKSGLKFSLTTIFGSTLTWIAIGNIVLSLLAIYGFVLPEGTVDQIIGAVQTKDWMALGTLFFGTIIPTIVRFIKDKKSKNPATA